MYKKLKSFIANDQLFYGSLVIIVAILSFWLGRLSMTQSSRPSQSATVQMGSFQEMAEQVSVPDNSSINSLGDQVVVASRSGKKYHLKNCPGAKQIKAANLISFASIRDAEAAGYTPASNCQGLQ
jgi:hypothetical protein